jgi:hypothetical protein
VLSSSWAQNGNGSVPMAAFEELPVMGDSQSSMQLGPDIDKETCPDTRQSCELVNGNKVGPERLNQLPACNYFRIRAAPVTFV